MRQLPHFSRKCTYCNLQALRYLLVRVMHSTTNQSEFVQLQNCFCFTYCYSCASKPAG